MKKALKPACHQAVVYARVSSKEQEKEGFSIPAQLKLLKEYAAANGFMVAEEYVDVETAKQTGRAAFGEMVAYLKAHPSVRVILVEKTDRLYRNLKDWVTIDELEVEIHFPKEGVVLSRESRSSEKFMHGIKVLMAKNYIDNLSEETRKGMKEKAEQGFWPSVAPLGYRNVTRADGKKIIEPDETAAPLIQKLFEWYARGDISVKEVTKKARAAGLAFRKSGARIPRSTVAAILRNRIYTGRFDWDGKTYDGRHQALISIDLWEQVQAVMDGRFARHLKQGSANLPSPALSHATPAAVRWSARSRRNATSIIIAPDTPISARETPLRAAANMCARKCWKRSSPNCSGGCDSMTRCWNGCAMRFMPAMQTSGANTRTRSSAIRPNTSGSMIASTPCMLTSSTDWWMRPSSRKCRTSGARSRIAASARSTGTRTPTNPIWKKAWRFSNSRGTPNGCSRNRNRVKNAACSIFYYRTALGRMERWS